MVSIQKSIVRVLCGVLFFGSISIVAVFARSDFDMMQNLEEQEKVRIPDKIERPTVEYDADALRDPFLKEKEPEVQAGEEIVVTTPEGEIELSGFTVKGIIRSGRLNQAIINDKVVREGDTVEGVRIISINKEGIKVLYGEREFELEAPSVIEMKQLENPDALSSDSLSYGGM